MYFLTEVGEVRQEGREGRKGGRMKEGREQGGRERGRDLGEEWVAGRNTSLL